MAGYADRIGKEERGPDTKARQITFLGKGNGQDFINGMKNLVSQMHGGRHAHHRDDGDANDASGMAPSPSSTITAGLQSLESSLGNGQPNSAQSSNNTGSSGNNSLNVYV